MKLNALNIDVTDMKRSLDIFHRQPTQCENRFSIFQLGAMCFGLFNTDQHRKERIFGSNCVPNIQVDDVNAEYERIAALAPQIDPEVRAVGAYHYVQFRDEDANWVELYETRE